MIERHEALQRQTKEFGAIWTRRYRTLSYFSYVRATPLNVLSHALREHGVVPKPSLRVLDFGFGHGYGLLQFDRSCHLHGIELSDLAINAATINARKRGYELFEFKKTSHDGPERIEYPDDYFDVVICSHTIEHVHSDEGLLLELYRVLKPGGRCFLLVPTDLDHHTVLSEECERQNPDFPSQSFHVWLYNLETFRGLVEVVGFKILQAKSLDAILRKRQRSSRAFQVGTSLLFFMMPYRTWEWADQLVQHRGYHCGQCLVVATKLAASADNRE